MYKSVVPSTVIVSWGALLPPCFVRAFKPILSYIAASPSVGKSTKNANWIAIWRHFV